MQGTNGGYRLAREASNISALEVIRVIDGPIILTKCFTEHAGCDQTALCPVREPLRKVHEGILRLLAEFLYPIWRAKKCRFQASARLYNIQLTRLSGLPNGTTMKLPIYMDNHATTPMDPRVFEAMLPYFTEDLRQRRQPQPQLRLGSRRSGREGAQADRRPDRRNAERDRFHQRRHRIEQSGDQGRGRDVCRKGQPHHHRGDRAQGGARHLQAARESTASASPICRCRQNGLIDLDQLREAITDKTILISIMYANNEIGVIQPIAEIGKIAKERGVLFHTDAVQAVGKVPVNVIKDNIDLMSISGAQDVRPEGRRRAVRAPAESARAADGADGRRRP